MKLVRILVSVPESMKKRLDALRAEGYTASGYIRHVLEREFLTSLAEKEGDHEYRE
jgi:hypothetical protein